MFQNKVRFKFTIYLLWAMTSLFHNIETNIDNKSTVCNGGHWSDTAIPPPMLLGQSISNEYTVSKQEPRFPVLSNNAISALIAFISRYRPIVSQEW